MKFFTVSRSTPDFDLANGASYVTLIAKAFALSRTEYDYRRRSATSRSQSNRHAAPVVTPNPCFPPMDWYDSN